MEDCARAAAPTPVVALRLLALVDHVITPPDIDAPAARDFANEPVAPSTRF